MTKSDMDSSKNTRHSGADVTAAALTILDDYGLADLTMRRLAGTLEVQPSALYWHFANKQLLLASVSDQIVARASASLPTGNWENDTRACARSLRDALLAYRDGAEVVSSSLALGLGATHARTLLSQTIAGGGFDPRITTIAADALLHFVLGHVSHEQQRIQADSLGAASSAEPEVPAGESFDFGIGLLLNGLRVHVAQVAVGD